MGNRLPPRHRRIRADVGCRTDTPKDRLARVMRSVVAWLRHRHGDVHRRGQRLDRRGRANLLDVVDAVLHAHDDRARRQRRGSVA